MCAVDDDLMFCPRVAVVQNKMSTQVGIVRTTYHTMYYSLARGQMLLFYVVQPYFAVRLWGSPACGKSAVEKQGRPITQSPLEKSGTSKTNEVDILSAYALTLTQKFSCGQLTATILFFF